MYEKNLVNYWIVFGNYIKHCVFDINAVLSIGKFHVDNYMDI